MSDKQCTEVGAEVPAITWPEGGFEWTQERLQALPIVRGIHAPAPIDGKALLAHPIKFSSEQYRGSWFDGMAQAAGRPWVFWRSSQESAARLQAEQLARPDHESWLELCAQMGYAAVDEQPNSPIEYSREYGLEWVTTVGIALHGLPFMIDLALHLARLAPTAYCFVGHRSCLLVPLRNAIAACSEAEHDAVLALLTQQAASTPLERRLRVYLCPHRSDWALASMAEAQPDTNCPFSECVLPPEAACAYLTQLSGYYDLCEGALLLQIRLHGAGALPLLGQTLANTIFTQSSEKFADLIVQMREPATVAVLAKQFHRKVVRRVLETLSHTYPAAVLKAVIEHATEARSKHAEDWAMRLALRKPEALAQALPALQAGPRARLQSLVNEMLRPEAPPAELPPVLREPPWLRKAQATELLDGNPLRVLPARMPKLPKFFEPQTLRRPVLRSNGLALPVAALSHIASMLAISKLEAPYAGLALVREAGTSASLAEFAWDVFEAWLDADAPAKESWAFIALGLLGDDETARRLAPRIREWPGESAHKRAVTGLGLLAAIGSDVALMHLNGIAGKVKFKALQERAKEKIAAVAQARGFTAAELADRLVPDLGLDEHGTLALDFGPRQFFVGFDEALKPFVKDAKGLRLKDLPKPLKADDAALAQAAVDLYKQVKKDAKAIASLQVTRLEMSMVERRRWRATDFGLFFLEHPLMRHLAARVVWGVYGEDGHFARGFRVAEDGTLADANDEQTALADDAVVGIVHVLDMPAALQAAFGQVFADYEIVQPFKQLGRETYALSAEERISGQIKRFESKTVSTGSVMGLVNRGWERGAAQDAGWVGWFSKRVGGDLEVNLELDPGTLVGEPTFEPKQRIPQIVLRRVGTSDDSGLVNFSALDPIVTSELLRDADLLAPYKEET